MKSKIWSKFHSIPPRVSVVILKLCSKSRLWPVPFAYRADLSIVYFTFCYLTSFFLVGSCSLKIDIIFKVCACVSLCVCVYVCEHTHMCIHQCMSMWMQVSGEAWVIVTFCSWRLLSIGAWNQTWVLCKSKMCFNPQRHLPSPHMEADSCMNKVWTTCSQ